MEFNKCLHSNIQNIQKQPTFASIFRFRLTEIERHLQPGRQLYTKNAFAAKPRPRTHFCCIWSPRNVSGSCKYYSAPLEEAAAPSEPLSWMRRQFETGKEKGKGKKGTGKIKEQKGREEWNKTTPPKISGFP